MNKVITLARNDGEENVPAVMGIDLAKNVFALHAINKFGKPVLVKPQVRREQLLEILAQLPPCIVGMEACSGAHHWVREMQALGHTPKLMAPKFVIPYRMQGKRGKNDANDAAAICEAVTRPNMRFVPVKGIDAQAILTLHRVRQGFVEERTAAINRIRGLMSEFGVVLPLRAEVIRKQAQAAAEGLPGWVASTVYDLLAHMVTLDMRVAQYDEHLKRVARSDDRCQRLMALTGIAHITATALVASIGNGHEFRNGRQLAAWLGLVPGQYSSGGKIKLGHITKAGDGYLRTLLILGARAMLANAARKNDRISRWAVTLQSRAGYGKALVAIAAKNARIAWALLAKGQDFHPA